MSFEQLIDQAEARGDIEEADFIREMDLGLTRASIESGGKRGLSILESKSWKGFDKARAKREKEDIHRAALPLVAERRAGGRFDTPVRSIVLTLYAMDPNSTGKMIPFSPIAQSPVLSIGDLRELALGAAKHAEPPEKEGMKLSPLKALVKALTLGVPEMGIAPPIDVRSYAQKWGTKPAAAPAKLVATILVDYVPGQCVETFGALEAVPVK